MTRGDLPCLALCTEYPLSDKGGVSVVVRELVEGLAGDFKVVLVSPDRPDAQDFSREFPGLKSHIPFQLGSLPPSPAYSRIAIDLASRLQSEGVGIAHFHCGGIFGWGNRWPGPSIPEHFSKRGIKTLWTNHSTELPERAFAAAGRPKWISDSLAPVGRMGKIRQTRAVDLEIAVSAHNRRFLQEFYPAGGKTIEVVYHSRLDEDLRMPAQVRQPRILAVGSINPRKGQDVLVQAFLQIASRFPEWELDLVGHDGGGGCWQEIERLKSAHPEGKRVNLLGSKDRPMELMARTSIFVQPSREEALGLALQEAVFAGCPSIGSAVGGIPEVLDEGKTGLLVPADDVAALADAMARLIPNPGLREQMGRQGRESILAKGMTRRGMIQSHGDLYHRLAVA